MGPGKTTYAFSVTFHLACYQQAGRVWSGRKGMENTLALAENVYVVLPTPVNDASRVLKDYSRVMLRILASLTVDSRGINYNSNMFMVQATWVNVIKPFTALIYEWVQ